ncbi:hypothetical protein M2281_005612 [Mesorhizobium soli]|nr:zinc ribbon domain-containing protein [Mesorhizobium soli]MDH6234990.1 hypothetical protein [Mesorhizobium soli]
MGTSKNGTVHRYYTCSNAARTGKSVCAGRSIRMDTLDELVIEHMSDRLLTSDTPHRNTRRNLRRPRR